MFHTKLYAPFYYVRKGRKKWQYKSIEVEEKKNSEGHGNLEAHFYA
jgi:hypothetical protein